MRIVQLTVLSGLVAAAAACGGSAIDVPTGSDQAGLSENACQTHCQTCPPNKICILSCELVGNCNSRCTTLALCVEGYHWDEQSCTCLPDGGGVPCGNKVCGPGTFCCNASCGICAPLGGFCIQIACAEL